MLSPRWKKIVRDLLAARGRMLMIVAAIAVSIFGVGTILSAGAILNREISRNYLGTQPASAFLELERVDPALVQAVRQQPGIAQAEATSWVTARVEVKPDEWLPMLLFGSMGAITWAIRGTGGWGGIDGTIVPGMTWGLL